MDNKNTKIKTADTWTMSIDEMLTEAGLTPKEGNKTGSCIMPAPRNWKSASQSKQPQTPSNDTPEEQNHQKKPTKR